MRPDVTSIGDVNVDVLSAKIPAFPSRDSQVLTGNIEITSGGCAANFAKAIASLGLRTRLIGCIGEDLFSDFLESELEMLDLQLRRENKTGITLAINLEDDTRSFITYTGSNSCFALDESDLGLIEGRCLHIASFFLQGLKEKTPSLIEYAHEKKMITSFDTGWDPAGWSRDDRELVKCVLSGVDVFFPNIREAEAITGIRGEKKICDELLDLGVDVVALKKGSSGSVIASADGFIETPAFKVDSLDTTGAGDVFNAAFIYSYLEGQDLEGCARFASVAAALSTRGYGSSRYPCLDEVKVLL